MSTLADFQRLAQTKAHGTFAYDAARDQVRLEQPRGRIFGRALAWLRSLVRGRSPAQEQVTEKFFAQVKGFYGEDVLQSVLAQKAGRPFTQEHPPRLSARHVRRVLDQSNATAAQWLRPVLAETKAAPHDIGPLWNSLAQRQLLCSGYAQTMMQQQSFPEGSDAEHLRQLMAGGFFRLFGEPPELRGAPGRYNLGYRSEYLGTQAVPRMEDAINLRGAPDTLSEHQIARFCPDGRLDAAAFWKALNSQEPLKGHPYGAQTDPGPGGPHLLARDLQRSITSTKYTINGKTEFANPPALLAELWRAAEGNPACFTGLCNLLSQTVGNQFHGALQDSHLREYTDFYMRDSTQNQERTLEVRTNGKARALVQWGMSDAQTGGQVTSLAPSETDQVFFALGDKSKAERQQELRVQVSSTGYANVEHMHAQFDFFSPLAQLRVTAPT